MKKLAVLLIALAACSKDTARKSEPAPAPTVTAPAPTTPPAGQDQAAPADQAVTPPIGGAAIPPGNYEIDPAHSAVIWRALHFNAGYTYGWFRDFKGSFVADPDPARARVELVVQAKSVDSGVVKRDDHLRSPDFFNAEQFPTITFRSTRVEPTGSAIRVTGDLELHGVKKAVTLDVTPVGTGVDPMNNTRAGYQATITLKRSDFGMNFMPQGIGDDIQLILAFEGVKK